jgi:hypothetical protein
MVPATVLLHFRGRHGLHCLGQYTEGPEDPTTGRSRGGNSTNYNKSGPCTLLGYPGRGWFNSPSFSGYKDNIVISESGAYSQPPI